MKPCRVYKKQFSIFIIIVVFLFLPLVFLSAETAESLRQKIDQRNYDIDKLEQEIKEYQKELNNLGKQKMSLNVSIKELDITQKKLVADIKITENKISKTNIKIEGLNSNINIKENSISNNLEAVKIGIREINELEANSILEIILSEDDFSVAWNDIDNLTTVHKNLKQKTGELRIAKSDLETTKKETIMAKNELLSLKSKLSDQKKIVDQNTTEKKKLLAQTKNNETSYQKLLADRLAKKEAFEKELEEYESQLKFTLDPSLLPTKGVLSWPLDDVYVTQLFGVTSASKRLYASGSHSGIDLRASIGTPVKATADGIVLGTGNTDLTCPYASFGKFVFIKHSNGLATAYGHMSLIKVEEGQKVTRGQIIGYSGNTGHTTGPHLHLTVYASQAAKMETRPSKACEGKVYTMPIAPTNAYLDPMFYLPSYK